MDFSSYSSTFEPKRKFLMLADAAEVLEVHVLVGRHVGVGGHLTVRVVPVVNAIFFIIIRK